MLRSVLAGGSESFVLWGGDSEPCFTSTVGAVIDISVFFFKNLRLLLATVHVFFRKPPKLNEATSFNLYNSIFIPTVMISYGSEALIGS